MNRLLCAFACAGVLVSGCSSTSILSDVPQTDSRLPPRTSYGEFLDDYRGAPLSFVFRDGRTADGILVDASPDSMVWTAAGSQSASRCSTRQLALVKSGPHLVPTVVGMTVCGFCFFGLGGFIPGDGGGAGPHNYLPNACAGIAGLALGYVVGRKISEGPDFIVEGDSLRQDR